MKETGTYSRTLVRDAVVSLALTASISLLLELIIPGLISSLIDLNALIALAVVVFLAEILLCERVISTRRQKAFFLPGSVTLVILLLYYFALQLVGNLLALAVCFLVGAVLAVSFFLMYDRRSNNKTPHGS